MKKLILILSCLFIFTIANSQRLYVVPYYDWSSKTTFMLSPSPMVTGYGYYSDSLSRAFNGVIFYEYAGDYYPIESWADYYYWYVNKYWYQFVDPGLYEFYYFAKDDFGMAQYICSHSYRGRMYPTRFAISFPGRRVFVNNLSRRYIRWCTKNDSWENKNYVANLERNLRDNKNRPKPIVTKFENVRVVDREKIRSRKRNVTIVKYNNSRSNMPQRNNTDKSRVERNRTFDKPNRENTSVNSNRRSTDIKRTTNTLRNNSSGFNRNTNSTNRRTSIGNRSSVNRSRSTNTNRSNVNRTTNSRQTRSGKTIKR